ncbi:MAG: DUF4105 domain-containing protein [Bdellovibrio sp.]|nr:DUF4105 domain-containing protein [Bdellovibrio sp.]
MKVKFCMLMPFLFGFLILQVLLTAGLAQESKPIKITRKEQRQAMKIVWVQNHRQIIQTNRKYAKRLADKQTRGEIVGLELVVASSTSIRFESQWGHALFRFVDNVGDAENDVGLGFVADLNATSVNYVMGLLGGYPVFPVIKSLRLYNTQYVKSESRPLDRYVLPSNQKIRNQMVNRLLSEWKDLDKKNQFVYENAVKLARRQVEHKARKKWGEGGFTIEAMSDEESGDIFAFVASPGTQVNDEDDLNSTDEQGLESKKEEKKQRILYAVHYNPQFQEDFGRYTFAGNNCAGALVRFLEQSGIPSKRAHGVWARIPNKLPNFYRRSLVNPFPAFRATRAVDVRGEVAKNFNISLSDLEKGEKWPKDALAKLTTLELKDKMLILDQLENMPDEVRDSLVETLPPLEDRLSYGEIYDLKNMPNELYELCADQACIQSQLAAAMTHLGEVRVKEALEEWKLYRRDYKKTELLKLVEKQLDFLSFIELLSKL